MVFQRFGKETKRIRNWRSRREYSNYSIVKIGQNTEKSHGTLTYRRIRICKIVDFAVSADHRIKLKEYKKKDKYLALARELKKLWNMKVTIIPIVIGAFGTEIKDY